LSIVLFTTSIFAGLKIGIIGDQTGTADLNNSYSIMKKLNPIDLAVNIYSKSSENIWNPIFDNVSPGEGIIISNLSSVIISDSIKVEGNTDGTRIEFSANGQRFWDQIDFNPNKQNHNFSNDNMP
jgi:hypothetical protein